MKLLILIFLISLFANSYVGQDFSGFTWAVLVAGSKDWENYRHQSDVYHAYQLVKSNGIPDTNIIVMHYDDIANNPKNAKPGQVFNKPDGPDVYQGVPKDYTGDDVTTENFLKVLSGDNGLSQSGRKVLQSGPNDHVFIYFCDHGAVDLIAFPSGYLFGEDLNKAIQNMYDNQMFAKLVFYMEACFSASMFDQLLPNNINVYAITAANATQSSYSTNYDPVIKTFLADEFSFNWMDNSETSNTAEETLQDQYEVVKSKTTGSHVMQYGDMDLADLPVAQFQGQSGNSLDERAVNDEMSTDDVVDSGDVPIKMLNKTIESTTNSTEKDLLIKEMAAIIIGRQFLHLQFKLIVNRIKLLVGEHLVDSILNLKQQPISLNGRDCYRQLVNTFHDNCLNLNKHTFVFLKLYIMHNICNIISTKPDASTLVTKVVDHLKAHCSEKLAGGYFRHII